MKRSVPAVLAVGVGLAVLVTLIVFGTSDPGLKVINQVDRRGPDQCSFAPKGPDCSESLAPLLELETMP